MADVLVPTIQVEVLLAVALGKASSLNDGESCPPNKTEAALAASYDAINYEVLINDRLGILRVENNGSIEAAAGDFCHMENMDGQPECIYLLTEAIMKIRGKQQQGQEQGDSDTHASPSSSFSFGSRDDEVVDGMTKMRARALTEFHGGRGVLLFVHLKKCGGMTLQHEVIEPAFRDWPEGTIAHAPEEMRWFFNSGDEAMMKWTREFSQAKVVADHIPFGFHSLIAPRPFVYITVLREPRRRILSYYKYLQVATDWEYPCMLPGVDGGPAVQSICKNNWWPAGLSRNASIPEWLERQLTDGHYVRAHIDNYQTRMVCGPTGMKQISPASEETLLCAKAALRGYFEIVGLTERLDETACLFDAVLGFNLGLGGEAVEGQDLLPHVNSNAGEKEEEEAALLASIPDFYVRLDQELYRYAQSLMEEKLKEYPQCRRRRRS